MIDGTRRGYMAGAEMGRMFPTSHASDDVLHALARCVYNLLQEGEYAHIDPEEHFIDGFVVGFCGVTARGEESAC